MHATHITSTQECWTFPFVSLFSCLAINITLRNPFRITRFRLYIEGPFIPFGCTVHSNARCKPYIPLIGKFIALDDCQCQGAIRSRLPPAQYLDLCTLSSVPLRGAYPLHPSRMSPSLVTRESGPEWPVLR